MDRVHLEKVRVRQLLKDFHTFYGARMFLTLSTTARDLTYPATLEINPHSHTILH